MPSLTNLLMASAVSLSSSAAWAAPQRVVLEQSDLSSTAPQTVRLGTVKLGPGDALPWHIHSGIEIGYVTAGQVILSIAGTPDRVIEQGGSFQITPGAIHRARAPDDCEASLVVSWVNDTGAPLSTPAAP